MRKTFFTCHVVAILCAALVGCGGGGSGDSSGAAATPSTGAASSVSTPPVDTSTTIAAECMPSAAFSFGGGSTIAKVAATELVLEMQGVDAAAAGGADIVQAMGTTPGNMTFQLYTLAQGQCTAAIAAQSVASDTISQAKGTFTSGTRVFVVLKSTDDVLVQVCGYAGTETQPCDSDTAFVSGLVRDASQSPVAGATVSVVNNGSTYTSKTDASGLFSLQTPTASLPAHFVATIYDGVHAPAALTFDQDASNVYTAGAVSLAAVTPDRVPLDLTPTVHHLGDSNFSGSVNSQFQFPSAEGLSVDYPFQLEAASLAYTTATFSITAKGIECPDTLSVNGSLVATFGLSPADGSYANSLATVPMNLLRLGANVATVTSHVCSGTDYDDFEITDPVLSFQ